MIQLLMILTPEKAFIPELLVLFFALMLLLILTTLVSGREIPVPILWTGCGEEECVCVCVRKKF